MRRCLVVLGTLAVHAVVGALLLVIDRHPAPSPERPSLSIEVVESPSAQVAVLAPSRDAGGSPAPARSAVVSRAPRAERARAPRWNPEAAQSDADPRGAITFDRGGGGEGDGTGTGTGRGGGIGFGTGGGIAPELPPLTLPPAPPPPKVSKARPARLIFPSRQREVDDGELFVMRVTVDADGYVAGARLVRGFGGRRDEVAQNQIWRFRYDPAHDDDGEPIQSVVEQRFLVQ